MTLVDTSVWVDHLRNGDPELRELLKTGSTLIHPFIIGEIACGRLRNRERTIGLLAGLSKLPVATHDEVLYLLSEHDLGGAGIGYVDAHLLASLRLTPGCELWTRDKALMRASATLKKQVAGGSECLV